MLELTWILRPCFVSVLSLIAMLIWSQAENLHFQRFEQEMGWLLAPEPWNELKSCHSATSGFMNEHVCITGTDTFSNTWKTRCTDWILQIKSVSVQLSALPSRWTVTSNDELVHHHYHRTEISRGQTYWVCWRQFSSASPERSDHNHITLLLNWHNRAFILWSYSSIARSNRCLVRYSVAKAPWDCVLTGSWLWWLWQSCTVYSELAQPLASFERLRNLLQAGVTL